MLSRILVVEDEQLVALDIEKRLEASGYSVTTASSGEEAIALVQQSTPDLLLMDIKLGSGIDGIETAKRIRATTDVPVIYLTAYADETTLGRARASEPYGYVLKPFDVRELKATVEMALQRHGSDVRVFEQEQVQEFLAEASARLADTLDYETIMGRAADLLVPRHANACVIRMHEGKGRPAATVERPRDVARLLDRNADAHVPIVGRGRLLGEIVVTYRDAERDAAIIEDFAHRLTMAVDNALLYREAQQALRLREEVLAVVSHDLRTPLGTILLRAEMLARGAAPAASADRIVRTAERMNHLIDDLVDAAAIDAQHFSLKRAVERPGALVVETVDGLRPLAEEKAVRLEAFVETNGENLLCDHDRVLQVLSNLVSNAIKFTPRGGSVTVKVQPTPTAMRFTVKDDGPGIPSDVVSHLFERFWRAESRRGGAGLGLYIAKAIVEGHGGTIGVETEPGHGTVFYFGLPRLGQAA